MRLAHPPPKLLPTTHPRLVPMRGHPTPEIVRADPAGIHFAEEGEEGFGFGLLLEGGRGGVVGGDGVQEGPG